MRGEIAGLGREGAAALGAVGPPLTPRSVVLYCAGKYGPSPPGTPHRGGVGMEGLEAVLGLDWVGEERGGEGEWGRSLLP